MRGSGSVSRNLIDSLIRSVLESEDTPVMWASADVAIGCDHAGIADPAVSADPAVTTDPAISADRPVRRSDGQDSSGVSRGRVAEPRNTGNVRRSGGEDESSRRRDEVARGTNDRSPKDRSPKDHRGGEIRRDDRGGRSATRSGLSDAVTCVPPGTCSVENE